MIGGQRPDARRTVDGGYRVTLAGLITAAKRPKVRRNGAALLVRGRMAMRRNTDSGGAPGEAAR